MRLCAFPNSSALFLALGLIAASIPGRADDAASAKKAIQQDRVVAGSSKDFLEVRHLVLKGSNEAIGQALATLARERYQLKPEASSDRFRTRVRRRYLEKTYPILVDRMRGVASAFGNGSDDDAWDFSGLSYLLGSLGGCSVVYYPPGMTADGHGIVSRNYDFTTGTLMGAPPRPGQLPATARPYVIEMHPDRGYASLAVCAYDLLSGVLDGVNSEGLTVALLADDEIASKFPIEPVVEGGVGLGILQMPRMLLDTCANVEEAKGALLTTKQYYEFLPVHYLIADRHGKAFVWEYSQTRNREHILENPGKPLITTNFSLHRHLEGKNLPSAKLAREVCPRYCALAERTAEAHEKVTVDFIKECHKVADATRPSGTSGARRPVRTLWHALYVPEQQAVQISFYLHDEAAPDQPGKVRIVRSDYLEFALQAAKPATK
jgi:penicillin V acylase-like amidase (Ntn superfamily)